MPCGYPKSHTTAAYPHSAIEDFYTAPQAISKMKGVFPISRGVPHPYISFYTSTESLRKPEQNTDRSQIRRCS